MCSAHLRLGLLQLRFERLKQFAGLHEVLPKQNCLLACLQSAPLPTPNYLVATDLQRHFLHDFCSLHLCFDDFCHFGWWLMAEDLPTLLRLFAAKT